MDARLTSVVEMAGFLNVPVWWLYEKTRERPRSMPHVWYGEDLFFDERKVLKFLCWELYEPGS